MVAALEKGTSQGEPKVLEGLRSPVVNEPQPQIILDLRGEDVVIPDIATNPSLAKVLDPERVAYRQTLQEAATGAYSKMPEDPLQAAIYLATMGIERHELYMDRSPRRIARVQWNLIEVLAEHDMRFNNEHPAYNDRLREDVHNRIASIYPSLERMIDRIAFSHPERFKNPEKPEDPEKPEKMLETKNAAWRRLHNEFPYFPDAVAAAQRAYGLDEVSRGSLELLYTENRIVAMYAGLMAKVEDVRRLRLVQQHPTKDLIDDIREYLGDKRDEGALTKALTQHELLQVYPLPQLVITGAESIDGFVGAQLQSSHAGEPHIIFPAQALAA